MRFTRNIRYLGKERIYAVVRNVMTLQADVGRVLFFSTLGYTGVMNVGVDAAYRLDFYRPNALVAGVVETPIPPGAHGWLLIHGWVSNLYVWGSSANIGAADPNDLILYPNNAVTWSNTTAGAMKTIRMAGGALGGTYMSASLAQVAGSFAFCSTSFATMITDATTAIMFYSAFVRLV